MKDWQTAEPASYFGEMISLEILSLFFLSRNKNIFGLCQHRTQFRGDITVKVFGTVGYVCVCVCTQVRVRVGVSVYVGERESKRKRDPK